MTELHNRTLVRFIALILFIGSTPASAATIDGALDGEYGLPLSTQITQTGFGDTSFGPIWQEGSELDQGFAYVEGGTLFLLFTGNLQPFASEPLNARTVAATAVISPKFRKTVVNASEN